MQRNGIELTEPICPSFFTPAEWRAILADFFQHAMDTWVSILQAAKQQNMRESSFYAHRLKGCAGLMGFHQLSEAAAAYEQAALQNGEVSDQVLDQLQQALIDATHARSSTQPIQDHGVAS